MSDSQEIKVPFRFTGDGFEYFKIWIVNIVLTVLTLGIYSAWAKVRNRQYFYGNTDIADSTLVYDANPVRILIGRIIAIGIYLATIAMSHVSPMVSAVLAIVLFIVLPWIVVKSLRFNAKSTQYRNIRFHFHGTIGGAYKYFVGWPILGMLTFGLLMPFVWKKQAQYITNNHAYGNEKFDFDVSVSEYYKVLLIMIGGSVVFFILLAILIAISAGTAAVFSHGNPNPVAIAAAMIPIMIAYVAFILVMSAYVAVSMNNIHFNNTHLQNHYFEANWSIGSYLALIIVNSLGVIFTLGLFMPWAKVRTARYKAEHLALVVVGTLDGFVAANTEDTNAIGEGIHDIFDIDISL